MLARCVGSAVLAAALVAAVEAALAGTVGVLAAAFGLYGALGLAIAVYEAALLRARRGAPSRLDRLAWLPAIVVAFVVAHTARHAAAGMENRTFALATTAAGAAVGVVAGALLVPAIARRVTHRVLGAAAIVTLLGLGAAAPLLMRVEWRNVRLGAPAGLALLLAAQVVSWRFLRPSPRAAAVLAGAVVVALVPAARIRSDAAATAADRGLAAGTLLALAQRAADRDGDGFAARFGGGDCDDARADVHPGAHDVPGDGIDQNCLGGDARAETPKPAKTPKAAGRGLAERLLLITVDAVRADRLGVAGYRRPVTPTLDALARAGVWFRNTYAQAPNTPRSFPSIVTSRYPSQIAWGKQFANYSPITAENNTVFEAIAAAGIRPIGIFSHHYFAPDRGIAQGFAEWQNDGALTIAGSNTDIAGPRVAARVMERLAALAADPGRWVLWTHFFEPHSRYVEHAEFPVSARGLAGLEEKYDHEIAFADRLVGDLLATLDRTGLAKSTAVLVFSDHGEQFGEHRCGGRCYFHGQTLYDEALRVPFILRAPGLAPREVAPRVMLIDVAPTICDLLGVAAPAAFRGRSLLPAALGEPLAERPVHAELLPAPSWNQDVRVRIEGDWKIHYRVTKNAWELYDLARDPGEKRNLWGVDRAASGRMRDAIVGFMESAAP